MRLSALPLSARRRAIAIALPGLMLLAGCDQLGIETPAQANQRLIEEGKAIGGSCRQSGRALEDCYQINPKVPKAAIFEGWRDMDGYMRENKIGEVHPEFPMAPPGTKGKLKGDKPLPVAPPAESAPPAAGAPTEPAKPAAH